MGTALMMEGLLSACYHVCPNYTNFQFGEAIYVLYPLCCCCRSLMSLLLDICIHLRHPDVLELLNFKAVQMCGFFANSQL